MSWLFSRALVAEYLRASSSAGGPYAPSSTTPTPQAYSSPDKTTGAWKRFPSGMTCEPLMDMHGEELLTLFRAASRVKTSLAPEKAPESAESVPAYGAKWRELSVKFDPDSCSWKTVRCLFPEVLDWSCLTLPDWGMLRDGELLELTTPALRTDGSGCGSWPTPQTRGFTNEGDMTALAKLIADEDEYRGMTYRAGAKRRAELWPTPRACKTSGEEEESWQKRKDAGKVSTPPLALAVKMFPTPNARDWKDSGPTQGNRKSPNLGTVAHWPTPRTAGMCGGTGNWEQLKKNTTLEEARQMGAVNGGQLNPTWVEWLMGWPLGWTAFGASETDKSRQHTIWRGAFSRRG